jgi:hypothetical protein
MRPVESKRSLVNPLDLIMENLDLKESSDQSLPNSGREEDFDSISNYSEEDFTAQYGGVSHGSEEELTSGLELHDNE